MPSTDYKKLIHLNFIVFIWGFTAILGKLITLSALSLVWVRIGIAVIGILVYALFKRKKLRLPRKNIAMLLSSGIVIALHWFTFFYAIKISNISITLAGLSTGAFFTSLLEPLFLKRKVILYEVFLGLLVIAGLSLIFSVEKEYIYGGIVALVAALLSAIFSIINAIHIKKQEATSISFYELLGGFAFLTIVLLFDESFSFTAIEFKDFDIMWLLVLGILCTSYPFIATVDLMKYISPYTLMLTINLEPIYGIVVAYLVFPETEKMSIRFYIGAFLILLTIALNSYLKNKEKKKLSAL